MTGIAGKYEGMTSTECREAILRDMKDKEILYRQEPLEQRVGTCWRCKTPIEIMSERQWFVKIKPDEISHAAHQVSWNPEHMLLRMENWVGPDGVGLVYLPAAYFCHPDPGVVLQKMR